MTTFIKLPDNRIICEAALPSATLTTGIASTTVTFPELKRVEEVIMCNLVADAAGVLAVTNGITISLNTATISIRAITIGTGAAGTGEVGGTILAIGH